MNSKYHVEQVVKCKITSSFPAARCINLSFTTKSTRVSEDDMWNLGSFVTGVVEEVTASAVIVDVSAKNHIKGAIFPEHLSDHQGLSTTLKSLLKPGYKFDKLLVIDMEDSNLMLSAKHSLICSGNELPSVISQLHLRSVVHGYVCNVLKTGCFVRYAGNLLVLPRKARL